MNKKILLVLVMFLSACLFIVLSYTNGFTFGDDEVKKLKVDDKLFDEYYKLMQDCFTNAKFEGIVKQVINGAYVESKYIAYSKDLDYKKIDVSTSGDKVSYVTTPDKVWYYFEKDNYVVYFANKKNIAKYNSQVYFDMAKMDGKITRSFSDGQITYKLTDYTNNIKQTFIFDDATKTLQFQLVESESGEKIETTYKAWEHKKIPNDTFDFPSRAAAKCID